jgi:hypothetical protein
LAPEFRLIDVVIVPGMMPASTAAMPMVKTCVSMQINSGCEWFMLAVGCPTKHSQIFHAGFQLAVSFNKVAVAPSRAAE